jgi:membrane protease YdiL (CAAX protease family)
MDHSETTTENENLSMNTSLDMKRIWLFLGFAFGIAWLTGLVIFLTGGIADSPVLIAGTPVTLALVLLALVYMWAPALGTIFTRWISAEGWGNAGLRLNFRQGWRFWLAAWILPTLFTVLGGAFYFLIFPRHFDPSGGLLAEIMAQNGMSIQDLGIPLWLLMVMQTVQALLLGPVINSFFTFGEELGWRGYLQPKLMLLGGRKTMLWMGLIWGVWHWPVILMGHNYGLDYPGAPFLGPLAMVWFCFLIGTLLGWLTLRGGSVWPAVIGHASINSVAGLAALVSSAEANPLLGPLPIGIVASLPLAVFIAYLFWRPSMLEAPAAQEMAG